MVKRFFIIVCLIVPGCLAWSQDTKPDSLSKDTSMALSIDPNLDYDDLLNDLDLFLDSLLAPHSYTLLSLSAGQGYFNYVVRTPRGPAIKEVKKVIWTPILGYFDKSGLGITLSSNVIHDTTKFRSYQWLVSPSYDYLKSRKLATGFAFTHYITKKGVRFYTSPLENELNGYFLWRISWLQPGITINYGWGSKTNFSKRDTIYRTLISSTATTNVIRDIVVKDTATIYQKNKKSIVDFSLAVTLRHDFYWLDVFSKKDHIRFSPLLSLSAGTQKFGFNQTTGATGPLRAVPILNNSQSVSFGQKFQLLSMALYLRSQYSFGKFFIEPQVYFDYYFPAETDNFMAAFSINAGFMF